MFKGYNLIGFKESGEGEQLVAAYSAIDQQVLPGEFRAATPAEVDEAVAKAQTAFSVYKLLSAESKAIFLETIGAEITALGDALIQRAMLETGLPEARLTGERGRTIGQLKLFADLLREGSWVEAVIDPALPERKPLPRADLRKMLIPIGPVAVFGASNFPFAFSTAGGDTAAAFAAGNPVVVKAHPSHLGTNELMASAIHKAAVKCNMPDGVFSFIIDSGTEAGSRLVKHPGIQAVGFTGSFRGGMALYKMAVNEREIPIPVFAEMSSVNPVILLPKKVKADTGLIAPQLAGSITLGAGQFCTNPGLIFLINDEAAPAFIAALTTAMAATIPATMLNSAIAKNYYSGRRSIAAHADVETLIAGEDLENNYQGSATLLQVGGAKFIQDPGLQGEIFGPASILVLCRDKSELLKAVDALHGQLTGSIYATETDLHDFPEVPGVLSSKAGRILFNGVPTGVEVCHAMVHGGPFPSTTDVRTTSVGADAIKRFVRPICFQDCPQELLPAELKNINALNIMRKVNGQYTRADL